MEDTKAILLEKRSEIEAKLNMFLSNEAGLKHTDIINRYRNQLSEINEQLALYDVVKESAPTESKKVDTVLQKMVSEFEYYMQKVEVLKSADKNYKNHFQKLEEINDKMNSRLLVLEKVDNLDISDILPQKVKNYRNNMNAIKNQLELSALEEKRQIVELSEVEKQMLGKMSMDMSIGMNLDEISNEENE